MRGLFSKMEVIFCFFLAENNFVSALILFINAGRRRGVAVFLQMPDDLHPGQHDHPTGVNPDHEYRQKSQRSIDGVIAGDTKLKMDVQPLSHL